MPNFTIEQLGNNSRDINHIRKYAYQYLIAGIAQEYNEIKGPWSSLDDFNKKNKLNFSSLLVYPFFVALSNGHSHALYNLFGKFESFPFGPVSISIYDMVKGKNTLEFFELNSSLNPLGVEVLATDKYANFVQIQNSIASNEFELSTGISTLSNIHIQSDRSAKTGDGQFTPLPKAIDSGIQVIKKQSRDSFFTADNNGILFQASYFKAFKQAYRDSKYSILEYEDIESPVLRPFYLEYSA